MGKTASLANIGTIADSSLGFRNRIINGDMRIDQRNAGASITQAVQLDYPVDRFSIYGSVTSKFTAQQNAGSLSAANRPAGFTNYLGLTSSSAYSVGAAEVFLFRTTIEGLNVADLGWGAAGAATVTLSFWVRSSLTGTFGGAIRNSAGDRAYPYSYTISAANTWEQKSVTIAGDTTGTWLTTNGIGIYATWSLGTGSSLSTTANAWSAGNYFAPTGATSVVGTNGATFYITGVQLEKGSTATSFDYRPYGTELALCQRYYEKGFNTDTAPTNATVQYGIKVASVQSANTYITAVRFMVPKRGDASITLYSPNLGSTTNGNWAYYTTGGSWGAGTSTGATADEAQMGFRLTLTGSASGGTSYPVAGQWAASAEL